MESNLESRRILSYCKKGVNPKFCVNTEVWCKQGKFIQGGSGECAAKPSEILTHAFGQKEHNKIVSILSNEDRDQAVQELRALIPLEKFTDEALNAIVEFWHDCSENIPEHCDIEQTLRPDGKIDLTISCIF